MPMGRQRWTEVTPSQFTHETEGLNLVKALLPPRDPFRAWSNFEFRDNQGRWHEVDLLVIGQRRIHLVELKYYSGTLRGDDQTWLRDGHRAEDSPLKLARRKAQRLRTKLEDGLTEWAQETGTRIPDVREAIPWVQESVFLHHPGLRCQLPHPSRLDLFGLDGGEQQPGLPGISTRLLEPPAPSQSVSPGRAEIIAKVMRRIGVLRRQREAGSWVIDEDPLGEGEDWQDWPAFHRVATTNQARIRFLITPPGAPAAQRTGNRRIAEHEFRTMSRLAHENLLRPIDLVENDLGIGLVYPRDERYQRLDLWLAGQPDGIAITDQLDIIRQVADALLYAHSNRVVHRCLSPHAVWVRQPEPGQEIRAIVGDWQTAGSIPVTGLTGSSGGVTGLFGASDGQARTAGATVVVRAVPGDADLRLTEAFQAPEQLFTDKTDRIRLDVFALGALSYYILTGRPPAANRAALRERLHREDGLDLAADLPQATEKLRQLILDATRPAVSRRFPDIRAFLAQLDAAEEVLLAPEDAETPDILEAAPGSLIDRRYRLERRLGSGSTAVGLLVTDEDENLDGPDRRRVLKVALDDAAAARLEREAEVLADLDDPHIVRLLDGPKRIGGRLALVLQQAGEKTLAEILRGRDRLSLDMQERYGTDLLEALVVLDRAGIDHRDIKPSNLGVREDRTHRAKHLVLFDFSLSRANTTAVTAGTQHYLDPFLDDPGRGRFDSAAERYSAAVVLFEMATGSVPRFGDGLSDPASLKDEATIEPDMFAPAVANQFAAFFRKALSRKASHRFDTAADMLSAWQAAFAPVPKSVPDDAGQRAANAQPQTLLTEAGLSARALSALEPYAVHTVADLVAVDPVRLNRMSGVAEPTRVEVKSRSQQWRKQFGSSASGREAHDPRPFGPALPDPATAAETLVERAGSERAQARRRLARLLVGLDPAAGPFASQSELAAALGVTPARVAQQMSQLQELWAADEVTRALLDSLAGLAAQSLTDFEDVATRQELTSALLSALSPVQSESKSNSKSDIYGESFAAGLLRLALDRTQALSRADEDVTQFATRRRAGQLILIAANPALLDPAEAIGKTADDLLARALAAGEQLVPAQRAIPLLQSAWARAAAAGDATGDGTLAVPGVDRLLKLAAGLSVTAALSGARDLHALDLAPNVALQVAIQGAASLDKLPPKEIQDRYRARFPGLPPLPDRPRLDELVEDAGLGLRYDEQARAYRPLTRKGDTTQLGSRNQTRLREGPPDLVSGGRVGHRLAESTSSRSFLALGIDSDRLNRAVDVLTEKLGAVRLDVTQLLIDALRQQAAAAGLPWETVRAADAAPAGSREAQGLVVLVQRSLAAIEAAIDAELAAAPDATRPVLLTDVAPLARYGHLNALAPRADLATRRSQAIWVEVPQLPGNQGPVIDGRPLPLAAPGQFFLLETDWLDRQQHSPDGDDQ